MVTVRMEVRTPTGNWLLKAERTINAQLKQFGLETIGRPSVVETTIDGRIYLDWPVENV